MRNPLKHLGGLASLALASLGVSGGRPDRLDPYAAGQLSPVSLDKELPTIDLRSDRARFTDRQPFASGNTCSVRGIRRRSEGSTNRAFWQLEARPQVNKQPVKARWYGKGHLSLFDNGQVSAV